ncbi:Short-chain dehydrogenase [Geosmithia morbida]|uniref:Short-chain dehydrogenase n=1 Tax=Geosmithia morbida TaxID=1094350 RepID=A0A9P4Z093_9HYPO|nr:Short-chain dehydrogenase [Geosmithia morbida]KAF4126165.1 Short-chain dehydrogenase [Geosmithia morbida]
MEPYAIKGKHAIVTGAGSGICLALARKMLEAGCSIVIADIRLTPEAQALVEKWTSPEAGPDTVTAFYQKTDMADWAQIKTLWEVSLAHFGVVDIVVSGAGLYEPPSSSFWYPPGKSPLAQDAIDTNPGVYRSFAVNTMGPIRLAQFAIDYWLDNRDTVKGNLVWIASLGAYVHSFQTPMYFASKAAIVSFVRSLGCLRKRFGIRNSALCPGLVDTPIFNPEYCRARVAPDDLKLSPDQAADVVLSLITDAKYGDGNVVETMLVGTKDDPKVNVREVPLEALYPTVGPVGSDNHLLEEEEKFIQHVEKHGMHF